MKKLCIYHGNCADGFGAAWSVKQGLGDDVEFHFGVYQKHDYPDVTGRDVIFVDFSYKRPEMLKIASKAKSLLILDHHKSAEEDLKDIAAERANITCMFDMNHSGAVLAWNYFCGSREMPLLIKYIEDRDLWRFALGQSREISAGLFSYPYDFEVWGKLMLGDVNDLAKDGVAIERKHLKDINELLKITVRKLKIAGHVVPAASLPYTMSSDAGHIMGKGQPFAACYWDTPTGRVFSLRSAPDGLDVSQIAVQFGGGGHKHAAGFEVTREKAQEFEIKDE